MATKKSNSASVVASAEPISEGGNFGSGFFLGLMTGAIGMFMFGTDKGQDVLQQIRDELENQAKSAEPEVREQFEQTRSFIAKAIDEVKDRVEQVVEEPPPVKNKPVVSADFPKFKRRSSSK